MIIIYCDGSCRNSGDRIGGWGAVLRHMDLEKKICGGSTDTSSNRMELMAAIRALKALKRHDLEVQLHSDSQYLIKGMNEWRHGWERRGWKNANGDPVANQDLWETLIKWDKKIRVKWIWVRGHAGHPQQEMAHDLANKGMIKATTKSKL